MKFEELEEAGAYKWTYIYPDSNVSKNYIILISGVKPFLIIEHVWSIDTNKAESRDILRGKPDSTLEKINLLV